MLNNDVNTYFKWEVQDILLMIKKLKKTLRKFNKVEVQDLSEYYQDFQ